MWGGGGGGGGDMIARLNTLCTVIIASSLVPRSTPFVLFFGFRSQ